MDEPDGLDFLEKILSAPENEGSKNSIVPKLEMHRDLNSLLDTNTNDSVGNEFERKDPMGFLNKEYGIEARIPYNGSNASDFIDNPINNDRFNFGNANHVMNDLPYGKGVVNPSEHSNGLNNNSTMFGTTLSNDSFNLIPKRVPPNHNSFFLPTETTVSRVPNEIPRTEVMENSGSSCKNCDFVKKVRYIWLFRGISKIYFIYYN